ncbi:MAG: hypothetical protein ACYDCQ_20740 [Dehalococcoidia bacterium]
MRRVFVALSAVSMAASMALPFAQHANAYEEWCFDDPIVAVNGNLMDVRVNLPLADLLTLRSTALTVTVPSNVSGAVVLNDISVFPMTTTIAHSKAAWSGAGAIPITVVVSVSASKTYNMTLTATPVLNLSNLFAEPVSASGYSNTSFGVRMSLGR